MMKKIIISILMLLVFMIDVKAEVYYGEYKLIESDIGVIDNDEYLTKEYKLYNTYIEELEDLGYLFDNEEYIKDDEDFIEEDIFYGEYVDNTEQYINIGISNNKLNQIYLRNILNKITLNEIEIYYKDELLDFECFLNYVQDINNLFDKNFETYMMSLNSRCFLRFILDNNYDINDIKIILYTSKDIDTTVNLSIDNEKMYPIRLLGDKHIITFNNESDETLYKYKGLVKKYKYQKLNKIITNNYVLEGENIIIEDYVIEKEYYKRDKLVIKDNIIIDNKELNIKDFIEYSSGNVISDCDVDYNINGEYNCNFILNDININKKVIVDIEKEVNNVVRDEIVNDIELENNYIDYDYYEYIELKDNEKVTTTVTGTTKINKELLSTNISDNNNKYISVIKYIIILLIIFIEILLFIKKKKNRSNVEDI